MRAGCDQGDGMGEFRAREDRWWIYLTGGDEEGQRRCVRGATGKNYYVVVLITSERIGGGLAWIKSPAKDVQVTISYSPLVY